LPPSKKEATTNSMRRGHWRSRSMAFKGPEDRPRTTGEDSLSGPGNSSHASRFGQGDRNPGNALDSLLATTSMAQKGRRLGLGGGSMFGPLL
jgi:hypothetical protein